MQVAGFVCCPEWLVVVSGTTGRAREKDDRGRKAGLRAQSWIVLLVDLFGLTRVESLPQLATRSALERM